MGGGGGQGRFEQRSEVFVKIQKKGGGVGWGGGGRVGGGGGQGRFERRSEVFVKIQKKCFIFLLFFLRGGGGVQVEVGSG